MVRSDKAHHESIHGVPGVYEQSRQRDGWEKPLGRAVLPSQHTGYLYHGGQYNLFTDWVKLSAVILMVTVEICLIIKRSAPQLLVHAAYKQINDIYMSNCLMICLPLFFYGWGRSTCFATGNIRAFTFTKIVYFIIPFIVAILTILPLTGYVTTYITSNGADGSKVAVHGSIPMSGQQSQVFAAHPIDSFRDFYAGFLQNGISVCGFDWLFLILVLFTLCLGNFAFFTWYKQSYVRSLWSSATAGTATSDDSDEQEVQLLVTEDDDGDGGWEAPARRGMLATGATDQNEGAEGMNDFQESTGGGPSTGVEVEDTVQAPRDDKTTPAAECGPSYDRGSGASSGRVEGGQYYARQVVVAMGGHAFHLGEKSDWLSATSSLVFVSIFIAVLAIILAMSFALCVVMFIPYAWMTFTTFLSRRQRCWISLGFIHIGAPVTSIIMASFLQSDIAAAQTNGIFLARAQLPTVHLLYTILFANIFFLQGFIEQLLDTEIRFVEEGATGRSALMRPLYDSQPHYTHPTQVELPPPFIRVFTAVIRPLGFIAAIIIIAVGTPGEGLFPRMEAPATLWSYPAYLHPASATACIIASWAWLYLIYHTGRTMERTVMLNTMPPGEHHPSIKSLFKKALHPWRVHRESDDDLSETAGFPRSTRVFMSLHFHVFMASAIVFLTHPLTSAIAMHFYLLVRCTLRWENTAALYTSALCTLAFSNLIVAGVLYIIVSLVASCVKRLLHLQKRKES